MAPFNLSLNEVSFVEELKWYHNWWWSQEATDVDEQSKPLRKKLVIDALAGIENLKTIFALGGKVAPDLRRRLLEIKAELEGADPNDPLTDNVLKRFSLLNREILDAVESTPKDKLS